MMVAMVTPDQNTHQVMVTEIVPKGQPRHEMVHLVLEGKCEFFWSVKKII